MALECIPLGKSTVIKWCTKGHVGVHHRVRSAQCLDCKKKTYRDNKEQHLARGKERYEKNKQNPAFKAHRAAYARAYRETNGEVIKSKAWAKYNSSPEFREILRQRREKNKQNLKAYFRLRLYGLTAEAFNNMVLSQNGACAICRTPNDDLCVDHDHKTGMVRGLLCSKCNTGIGHLCEDAKILRAAISYLEAHSCQ